MEITCPNCQNSFEAATRRATCQYCASVLDVWALLSQHTAPASEDPLPRRTQSPAIPAKPTAPIKPDTAPFLADPYKTTVSPALDSVLDLPPASPKSTPVEQDQVLEDAFSTLPDEFLQPVAKPPVVSPPPGSEPEPRAAVAPTFLSEIEEEPERRGSGRGLLWLLLFAVAIGAAAALIYYLRQPQEPVVATVATETPSVSPSFAPSVSPSPSSSTAASPTATPLAAEGVADPNAKKPSPTPTTANPAAGTPSATEPAGEAATRARAVNPETLSAGKYTLQVGAHPTEDDAKKMAERLIDSGLDARIIKAYVGQSTFFRVRVGAFTSKEEAALYGEQLKRVGKIESYFVTDRQN